MNPATAQQLPISSSPTARPHALWVLLWLAIFTGLPALTARLNVHDTAQRRGSSSPPAGISPRGTDVPPPVEPVRNLAVTAATARQINAGIAFANGPRPAARPFRFVGDDNSLLRATDCLAAAQLYEAGDDDVGQRAVAQVVLNRLRHPAFPKTVCGVVFQGAERVTGCQFTFTCDGALRREPSMASWEHARQLALHMLTGEIDRSVGYATHYHTDWVVPYWSGSLDKIAAVGTHLFFRWRGWWGTPPAFRGSEHGPEPVIRQLAFLSPAHRPDNVVTAATLPPAPAVPGKLPTFPDLAGPALAIGQDAIGKRFGPGILTALNSAGDAFAVQLDVNTDPARYELLAHQLCAGRLKCRLLGWTTNNGAPSAFPVDERRLASMSYAYLRIADSSLERSLYNCGQFPGIAASHCMRRSPAQPASGAAIPANNETFRLPIAR